MLYLLKAAHPTISIGDNSLEVWHGAIGDLDPTIARMAVDWINKHFEDTPKPATVRRVAADIAERGMTESGEIGTTVRPEASTNPAVRAGRPRSTPAAALGSTTSDESTHPALVAHRASQ